MEMQPQLPRRSSCCARRTDEHRSSLRSGTGHASRYVVGEVHRSTPCRVCMPRAVATLRHEACVDAHDVPLRGW